ncbi:hypothetical protein BKP35_12460 [Anaerobacillus arseniciselenatis]|uniref:FtsK domain-containing protein n=1 Tax=Anaerobacillus arseniciselenatis TaxID=85682 RepID=A0A1S2LEF8_9BACI|nr:DNA translocase FtsK [Anaerobacillus arseniciselenatis]OIJ10899.1 hypothetical protein BKP35_12460 [Anaerobacillus arseniciselenatis]
MFKKLKIAYQKVHSFLFGEESEHIHTRQERKLYYGRIKGDNDTEARMIHQYPKQGNFRFPIISDEEGNKLVRQKSIHKETAVSNPTRKIEKKREKVVTNIHPKRNLEQKEVVTEKNEKRKKFQGVNFKAQEIPSPVHAFKKQTLKVNRDEKNEDVNVSSKTNSLERNDVTTKITQVPVQENSLEVQPFGREEMSTFQKKMEVATAVKNELETAVVSTAQEEIKTEVAATVQEEIETEVVKTFQAEIKNEEIIATHEEIEVEEELTEAEIEVELATTEPEIEVEQEKEAFQEEAEIEETLHEDKGQVSSKTVVPFNVLMLQKDRVAHKKNQDHEQRNYRFPTLQLLNIPEKKQEDSQLWLDEKKEILEMTLANFNVNAKVVGVTKGPSVTRFEIQPEAGVKVSKVTGLTDDIKLSLAAKDIRIEAPIPGRNAIGIEVPNDVSEPVVIREILRSGEFQKNPSPLTVAMGLDISGNPVVTDIQKMPHGLIAGSTGSGKSVCINSILISIMFKATPDEVKLMLVDPKMVELAPYNDIPHLITPVITDAKQATVALKWAVEEMERRYELFVQNGVRDIKRYNQVMKKEDETTPAMPYIVIVIDELADLMMVSPQDVEDAICRIAQKARACGIHLLIATQRPSVDVITGLIKANIPTRVAFSVSSQADSRTIIDSGGAERLLGKGDMLLFENGASKPVRVQGNFVSDEEIDRVIALVKQQRKPNYLFDKDNLVRGNEAIDQEDDLFEEACYYVVEQGGASSSSLQRRFRIGFNRAARLIDMMEARGIISEAMGSKPRNVLVSEEELSELI